jgi:hypothetical protein
MDMLRQIGARKCLADAVIADVGDPAQAVQKAKRL